MSENIDLSLLGNEVLLFRFAFTAELNSSSLRLNPGVALSDVAAGESSVKGVVVLDSSSLAFFLGVRQSSVSERPPSEQPTSSRSLCEGLESLELTVGEVKV